MRARPQRLVVIGVVVLLAMAVFGDRVFNGLAAIISPSTQTTSVSGLLSAPTTSPSQSAPTTTTPMLAATEATASTTTSSSTTIPSTTTTTPPQGLIEWSEALDHVGERVTVEGPVVGTYYARSSNGSPTFLNIGRDNPDPDRLTAIIWGRNRGEFSSAPESAYRGETIRVTGKVSVYKGSAQIEVKSPAQIEIVP